MVEDPRILDLLEKMIEAGSSAEEVCADAPELLPLVREQWNQCQQIDARIDALFGSSANSHGDERQDLSADRQLPKIPGYTVLI